MRALFVSLLFVVTTYSQVSWDNPHKAYIKTELPKFQMVDYIVKTEISVPNVVINKFVTGSEDISEQLKKHLNAAADQFVVATQQERDAHVVDLPEITMTTKASKKRSIPEEYDVEATKELYKQIRQFLDEYDVKLELH